MGVWEMGRCNVLELLKSLWLYLFSSSYSHQEQVVHLERLHRMSTFKMDDVIHKFMFLINILLILNSKKCEAIKMENASQM